MSYLRGWPDKVRVGPRATSPSRPMFLLKAVSRVPDNERAVRLRRHFDPIRGPVVNRRRTRTFTLVGRRQRSHPYQLLGDVQHVGNEDSGYCVFLTAEL